MIKTYLYKIIVLLKRLKNRITNKHLNINKKLLKDQLMLLNYQLIPCFYHLRKNLIVFKINKLNLKTLEHLPFIINGNSKINLKLIKMLLRTLNLSFSVIIPNSLLNLENKSLSFLVLCLKFLVYLLKNANYYVSLLS